MNKPNFEYQTLDQVLTEGKIDSDKIKKMDPEAIGPETKKVIQKVYDGIALGKNVSLDYNTVAVQQVAREVLDRPQLRDGSSFRDIYVSAVINTARSLAYRILSSREKLSQAEDLDEVQGYSMEDEIKYLKGDKTPQLTTWWNYYTLGEKMDELTISVFKDLGFTLQEAQKLDEKYEQLVAKKQEQYKKLGIWDLPPEENVSTYLKQLGWDYGENQGPFLKKAVEEGVVLREPERVVARAKGLASRVVNWIKSG